jgi:hypothetical protein
MLMILNFPFKMAKSQKFQGIKLTREEIALE